MELDPAVEDPKRLYSELVRIVVPRPIGWISTTSKAGVDNLAPYSFFNAVCAKPPTVFFSGSRDRDGRQKDSVLHAIDTGVFVVNIVSRKLAEAMNQTSATLGRDESEFDHAGLTREPAKRVAAPRVAEADVHLECRVSHTLDLGDGGPMSTTLVFGEVVLLHARDAVTNGDGVVDTAKLDAIGRLGGSSYATTRDRFEIDRA